MRRSTWIVSLAPVLMLALTTSVAVGAQVQTMEGEPRFLLASVSSPLPVDVDRTPILQRRISLDLQGTTLKQALADIAAQAGLRLTYSDDVIPQTSRVHLRATEITVMAALRDVLSGTGVDVVFSSGSSSRAALVSRSTPAPATAEGALVGRVTDASTGVGVRGATVALEGTRFEAATDGAGRYRIADVPAAPYTVVVRRLTYADARLQVVVEAGEETTADFEIEPTALALDRVVVTGTAFETRVRTVPNPITVMTAREIELKGAANITELLRGEIPGVMPLSGGGEDLYSQIYVRGNAASAGGDFIKVYIDGVEVAHPTQLGTIDPKSIDRMEVIRGPQASVIYGSDAASGVLQIFTKKGSPGMARPRVDVQVAGGVMQSDHAPSGASTPLTQDYALEVSGGTEAFSYRAGASHSTVGEWMRNYSSDMVGLSGGVQAAEGPLTLGLTARWSERTFTYPQRPLFLDLPASPACPQCGNPEFIDNGDHVVAQNTVGLTLGYHPMPRWQHTLTVGQDHNHYTYDQLEPSLNTPADTLMRLVTREFRRRSVRYHTAYDVMAAGMLTARLTAGVDHWKYHLQGNSASNLLNAHGNVQLSPISAVTVFNTGWSNTGFFGMAELGLREQLYLTLAARLEDHAHFGEAYGYAVSPRVGASYVREVGRAEVKLRGQYGVGVRPPPPDAAAGAVYSTTIAYLPNENIAPEEKVGWDAGIDVFWGERASLGLTRYEEEGRGLIASVPIDVTGTPPVYQYQNIGVVEMNGWELEGDLNLGAVSLRANYSYSQSRIREVTEQTAANPDAILQVGDRTLAAPKHSGGGGITARIRSGTNLGVDGSVMAGARVLDFVAFYGFAFGGEPFRGSMRDYYIEDPAIWKWNVRADQAITDRLATFVRVANVLNEQRAEIGNFTVAPGRTTEVGLRFTH